MLAVRWKTTVAATLAAVTLTAGLAWGFASPALWDERPAVPAVVEEPDPAGPRLIQVRGVVVDEKGAAVAGAEVFLNAYTTAESHATTDADGSYTMTAIQPWVDSRSILARTPDGRALGLFKYGKELPRAQAEAPARVVLKPGREIIARVTSPAGEAVAEAEVEIMGDHNVVAHATTGADGQARLIVPADGRVYGVAARKGAVGFGCMIFGPGYPGWSRDGGLKFDSLPAPIDVPLGEPRVVRIKAVDEAGDPIVGAHLRIPMIPSGEGSVHGITFWTRMLTATTGPDGIALFDWLPNTKSTVTFFPLSEEGYATRRIDVPVDHEGVFEARLEPSVPIRGRVVLPDGSPARNVRVQAVGSGRGSDRGSAWARTDDDGTYRIDAPPGEAYLVWVRGDGLDAEPRCDLIARVGKPLEGVDFQLTPGTVLRGVATVWADARPSAGESISIQQELCLPPAELRRPGDVHAGSPMVRYINLETDAEGRYAVNLVPGTYRVHGEGRRPEKHTVVVAGQPEVQLDLHRDRPEMGTFSGRVADPSGKPVADAVVEVLALDPAVRGYATYFVLVDADGRFTIRRELVPTSFHVQSPDGGLAGITEAAPETTKAELNVAPVATASGVLLDQAGEPAAGVWIQWGCRLPPGEGRRSERLVFGSIVSTNDQGRFTLPSLVVGQSYEVWVVKGNEKIVRVIDFVRPEKPGPIDLGRVQSKPIHNR